MSGRGKSTKIKFIGLSGRSLLLTSANSTSHDPIGLALLTGPNSLKVIFHAIF